MATTGIANSFKVELLQGGHCFNAIVATTASASSGSTSYTAVSGGMAAISVGMAVTGTNVGAGTVVAAITGTSAFTASVAASAAISTGAITFTGDVFKMALVKVSPSLTYSATQTNIGTPGSGSPTTSNLGTDEVAATGGYTSGGPILVNVNPSLPGNPSTTATTSFNTVSWTSATISTTAGIVYNSSARVGNTTGRVVEILDFGGTQTVTNGTLTLTMPVNDGTTGLIRLA